MKLLKRILLVVLIILVLIQFIPYKLPPTNNHVKGDIIATNQAKGEIANILKTSCYDCHSNQTHYPWYSHIAPASWLLAHDIKEGKEDLNFSEWNAYDKRRKISKLNDIKEMVEKNEMPVPYYTFIHRKAKLGENEKNLIMKWSDELTDQILK
jgi:hypothetical protein